MEKVLAISDFEPGDRLAYWYDVASKVLVKHECQIPKPSTFDATLHHAELGDVAIVTLESEGIRRTEVNARTIANEASDVYLLSFGIEGSSTLCQDGREAVLGPGDFTLIDTRRPYSGHYSERWKRVLVKIPYHSLNSRLAISPELTARTISAGDGLGRLASGFVRMLPEHMSSLQGAAKAQVSEQLLDLAALALAAEAGSGTPAISSGRAVSLLHVRTAIESRLADPSLDPGTVAAAAGVSVRYANSLLAEQGTSIERLIVSRRLERCRRALEDPMQGRRTISEIAYTWGFSNPSHFVRRFKGAYGCAPGDYRRRPQD